jgi:hypothetical protein
MLLASVGIITIIVIIILGSIIYYRYDNNIKDTNSKMQALVDQINDSQYYEYKFDKKQDQNIKNIDQNVTEVHTNLLKLQNNVKYVEKNALLKDDIAKKFNSDKADIKKLNVSKATIANDTDKNNIIIEGGRTTDGNNEGWSAINFNGFYDNGEKRINTDKSRFRLIGDQRSTNDQLIIDQLDKKNNWHQYLMMADGNVGLNNNKLRISNNWTGFPDKETDQSEISNDTNAFKKLMIVGNKSAGGERKVGIWDTLDVNGTLNVKGQTNVNGPLYIKGGKSVHNPHNWQTHFPWTGDNKNYIRGDTEISGNTNNIGDMNIDKDMKASQVFACGPGEDCNKGVNLFRNNKDGADPNNNNYQGGIESWWGVGFRNKLDGKTRFMHDTRTGDTTVNGKVKANTIQLGDKFRLSGVGDAHGNDGWLRLFDKNGKDYYGGLATANLWTRDNSYLNGNTNITGNLNITGNTNITKQVCIDGICLTKADIIKLKKL